MHPPWGFAPPLRSGCAFVSDWATFANLHWQKRCRQNPALWCGIFAYKIKKLKAIKNNFLTFEKSGGPKIKITHRRCKFAGFGSFWGYAWLELSSTQNNEKAVHRLPIFRQTNGRLFSFPLFTLVVMLALSLNRWIYTRKEPFIKRQYLRAVTKKSTPCDKIEHPEKNTICVILELNSESP